VFEPIEPALRPVRHLARDAEHDKLLEESGGIVYRHAERLAERRGGDERGRREDVDRGGARIAAPFGNRRARRKPLALERRHQRDPVLGLLGQRVEKMPDPESAHPRHLGAQRAGTGQQRAGEGGHAARGAAAPAKPR
jgi:hypothetical protein